MYLPSMKNALLFSWLALSIALQSCCDCDDVPAAEVATSVDTTNTATTAAEAKEEAQLGPNEFAIQEGDTTYIMKQFYVVFLKKGANRDQDSTTAMAIQMAHLSYLDSLYQLGKLTLNGPYGDDGEIRGMSVYSVDSLGEAEALANGDPAVQAGRLEVEVHPWWAAKGSVLQ